MTEERKKFCEGCTIYEKNAFVHKHCRYLYTLENGEKCPCIDCLIKITCEDPCDEFDIYTNKSDKEKRSKHIQNGL